MTPETSDQDIAEFIEAMRALGIAKPQPACENFVALGDAAERVVADLERRLRFAKHD